MLDSNEMVGLNECASYREDTMNEGHRIVANRPYLQRYKTEIENLWQPPRARTRFNDELQVVDEIQLTMKSIKNALVRLIIVVLHATNKVAADLQ